MIDLMPNFPWLETMNSVACGIMMTYMLMCSIVMPGRGMWGRRIIIWVMSFALCIQIISPWAGWVPRIVWHGALLHIALACGLVFWRKEAMAFIRCKFSVHSISDNMMRRESDWKPFKEEVA